MHGHTIVCGDDALTLRIIDELNDAEISVVPLRAPSGLEAAGVRTADAVIAASADDALNLEVALLARQANPRMRVVARLSNTVLREALADGNGPGAVLDVADIAAPSVVQALLGRTSHTIPAAGERFVVSGTAVPRQATLRELYDRLTPVAILCGENSPTPGEVIPCPGRETQVFPGDWTTVIGTAREMAGHGVAVEEPIRVEAATHRSRLTRAADAVRAVHHDVHPMFYRVLAASVLLLVGSTLFLRLTYQHRQMNWLNALYFATETLTTTGYGDFSLASESAAIRLWAIGMMLVGAIGSALVVAFAADVLLSRRLLNSASLQRISHLRRHCVIVGLGSFGTRVADTIRASGHDVVVIERNEDNRYVGGARELGVPVIFGDATMPDVLKSAQIRRARAIAVLTEDDMTNIETGIVARELLGPGQAPGEQRVPIVVRIYDKALGQAVGRRLGFNFVRSTVDLATPWFMGAAMGLQVLSTFSVGQRSFMVGAGKVADGSELDGLPMAELSSHTRVIAVARGGEPLQLHPQRDTRLAAGDTVYMVGPFRELLATLRRGHRAGRPDTASRRVGG